MTVKELRKALKDMPDDAVVLIGLDPIDMVIANEADIYNCKSPSRLGDGAVVIEPITATRTAPIN